MVLREGRRWYAYLHDYGVWHPHPDLGGIGWQSAEEAIECVREVYRQKREDIALALKYGELS